MEKSPTKRSFSFSDKQRFSSRWHCSLEALIGNTVLLGFSVLIFFFFSFLGLNPWHMKVPRPGIKSELQLPAYTTATAMQDLSHVCDLHHSSQQGQILNPLSKARDRTHNLMVPSQIHFHCVTMGTPLLFIFNVRGFFFFF